MKQVKLAFLSGGILGFFGVIAGALGSHVLESALTADQLGSFETAVRLQMYHALFLILLGLIAGRYEHKLITYIIGAILLGIVLFSGSIYVLLVSALPVGLVTPLGGLLLIAGWAMFIVWAIYNR